MLRPDLEPRRIKLQLMILEESLVAKSPKTKPGKRCPTKPAATTGSTAWRPRERSDDDPIVEWLKRNGIAVTRKNYLDVFLGEPGIEVGPEAEEMIPSYLRRRKPSSNPAKDLY